MKTVLQELMDGFDAYQLESQNDSITIEKLKEVITKEYLEKEKQQILTSNNRGYKVGRKDIAETANDYYQDTYGSAS